MRQAVEESSWQTKRRFSVPSTAWMSLGYTIVPISG